MVGMPMWHDHVSSTQPTEQASLPQAPGTQDCAAHGACGTVAAPTFSARTNLAGSTSGALTKTLHAAACLRWSGQNPVDWIERQLGKESQPLAILLGSLQCVETSHCKPMCRND